MAIELGIELNELIKALFVYALVSTFVFIQPPEFRSAGFTLENLFHNYLGNRHTNFLDHQLRRISLTIISHIAFFPGFFVALGYFCDAPVYALWPENLVQIMCTIVTIIAAAAISFVVYVSVNNFDNHYTVRRFRQFNSNWQQLSFDVSREMMDPFAVKAVDSGDSGVYVLDSWLVRVSHYDVNIAKLNDARFTVTKVIDHPLREQNEDHQIITIDVTSDSLSFPAFSIHLQSRNIMQLIRDKVGSHFIIPESVALSISTVDRFIQAFRAVISENETFVYQSTDELENCFGCMAVLPNVRISKRCDNGECLECRCRPTWCHSCLARIFATEQDQDAPDTWLRGTARCPTCRSRFCCIDVLPMRIA